MTQALIASFKNASNTKCLNIIFEKSSFIFGIFHTKEINIISSIIRSYIYRKRCLQENITVRELLIYHKTHLTTRLSYANINDFANEWHNWLLLLLSKS